MSQCSLLGTKPEPSRSHNNFSALNPPPHSHPNYWHTNNTDNYSSFTSDFLKLRWGLFLSNGWPFVIGCCHKNYLLVIAVLWRCPEEPLKQKWVRMNTTTKKQFWVKTNHDWELTHVVQWEVSSHWLPARGGFHQWRKS